jgi:hypothetical protein
VASGGPVEVQLRHVKIVQAGGVAAGDPRIGVRGRLGLFVVRHPGQDLARLGKRRPAVRIIRAPHHGVDADDVAQANADGVLLELKTTLRRKKSLGKMAYLTILLLARVSSARHWHK